MSNGTVELIATTDVGPRIIRYGFVGQDNEFKENPGDLGQTGGERWRAYGGHRLWHAPENQPRTYAPDNGPVQSEFRDGALLLTQPVEPSTGIQKQMEIRLSATGSHVEVNHILTNEGLWDVELAPWALSVMAPGGVWSTRRSPTDRSAEPAAVPAVILGLLEDERSRWTWGDQWWGCAPYPQAQSPGQGRLRKPPGLDGLRPWYPSVREALRLRPRRDLSRSGLQLRDDHQQGYARSRDARAADYLSGDGLAHWEQCDCSTACLRS